MYTTIWQLTYWPHHYHYSFLVRALDIFLGEGDGLLPLSGQIPDLTATTEQYVQLQQAYQAKARADLERFTVILHGLLKVSTASSMWDTLKQYSLVA